MLNDYFNPKIPVEPSHIVLAAGASFALNALIEQIFEPGDGVLIATPYWAGLDLSFSVHNQVTAVPVHVPLDEFFDRSSIGHYEKALKEATVPIKAILVCNPHNPLGRCYPRETLDALADFCTSHKLHYLSDEVYALSQHNGQSGPAPNPEFISALNLDNPNGLIHVLYSLSKDFACNGIRLVGTSLLRNILCTLGLFHFASCFIGCPYLAD